MTNWLVLPIVLPIVAAIAAVLIPSPRGRDAIALGAIVLLVAGAGFLTLSASQALPLTSSLGDWPAPYGIQLILDRSAALLLMTTAVIALLAAVAARSRTAAAGRHWHALLLLLVAGLNGAYLAGDWFNLFVAFEILLLASYALLVHGGTRERISIGFAYALLNMVGSSVFLIALALLYGTVGTLNLADVALRLSSLAVADQALARTAIGLFAAVFALKAALFPLAFWLPRAYPAADPVVGALFAVMTKVGVFALIRLYSIADAAAPQIAAWLSAWLLPLALATIVFGTLGVLAARRLAQLAAYLVLISS
ncbi:MAG: cation:proton antiporter, partial [Steroidobacteraceae bacterium]|nr:cation:proton antiporter [Steroidobacteraceae bacterium]MDW8260673.1 proton-conducting transporter membrane subunit [Gammaproteobacteria bacterium]